MGGRERREGRIYQIPLPEFAAACVLRHSLIVLGYPEKTLMNASGTAVVIIVRSTDSEIIRKENPCPPSIAAFGNSIGFVVTWRGVLRNSTVRASFNKQEMVP